MAIPLNILYVDLGLHLAKEIGDFLSIFPMTEVHGIEADPRSCEICKEKYKNQNVTIHNFAIGSRDGTT
jgi:hypothetical protein